MSQHISETEVKIAAALLANGRYWQTARELVKQLDTGLRATQFRLIKMTGLGVVEQVPVYPGGFRYRWAPKQDPGYRALSCLAADGRRCAQYRVAQSAVMAALGGARNRTQQWRML